MVRDTGLCSRIGAEWSLGYQPFKVSGSRVLISMGGSCIYSCSYCYTKVPEFKGYEKRSPQEVLGLLQNLPREVRLIQVGCDTEVFANERKALELIWGLSELGREVSFSTKKELTQHTIEELSRISYKMQNGKVPTYLAAFIPIIGFETAQILEPDVPPPADRIDVVKRLHSLGVPVFVSLQPLLPQIPDSEIERVIQETEEHCMGYSLGQLVCTDKMAKKLKVKTQVRVDEVHWFPEGNGKFHFYYDGRIRALESRPNFWFGSEEAISSLRRKHLQENELL